MDHFRPYEDLEPPSTSDVILTLAAEARRKKNAGENVIDATVGIYRNSDGTSHVFPSVVQAGEEMFFGEPGYLPASGDPIFIRTSAEMIFGKNAACILRDRLATLGTVGGTGANAMWAAFHAKLFCNAPMLLSDPTWANHRQIFGDRGISMDTYPHLTVDHKYDMQAHADALDKLPRGSVALFHAGRTHNPTGVNPQSREEWETLARHMEGKIAFFDAAYLGFGTNAKEDAEGIRIFNDAGIPTAVAVSFAKNMGLYKERSGALLVVTGSERETDTVQKHLNLCARTIWSTPPAYGERVAAKVLTDKILQPQWEKELRGVAWNIAKHRRKLAEALGEDFSFLREQTGLFSLLGLTQEQVAKLREKYKVYMTPDSRINVMGIPEHQIEKFAEAIRRCMAKK